MKAAILRALIHLRAKVLALNLIAVQVTMNKESRKNQNRRKNAINPVLHKIVQSIKRRRKTKIERKTKKVRIQVKA